MHSFIHSFMAFVFLGLFAVSAHAATIVVNTGDADGSGVDAADDSHHCTLSEALHGLADGGDAHGCANSSSDTYGTNDTIHFDTSVSTVQVSEDISIVPPHNITIDGVSRDVGMFFSGSGRFVFDRSPTPVAITLKNITFSGTSSASILNSYHNLAINHCQFSGLNTSSYIIYVYSAAVSISDSYFTNNTSIGSVTVEEESVGQTTNVLRTTFYNNTNNALTGPTGGAIFVINGALNLINSTFWGNSSFGIGGAVRIVGTSTIHNTLTINNSTIYANKADIGTGSSSTIDISAMPEGGGIEVGTGSQLIVSNSIIYGNTRGAPDNLYYDDCLVESDATADATRSTNNILFTISGCRINESSNHISSSFGLTSYNSIDHVAYLNPATTPLAIDAGNDSTCATEDQVHTHRPSGAHCDIGAIEYVYPAGTGGSGGGASGTGGGASGTGGATPTGGSGGGSAGSGGATPTGGSGGGSAGSGGSGTGGAGTGGGPSGSGGDTGDPAGDHSTDGGGGGGCSLIR
ncbi:MAG: hypothetical protein IPJ69_12020 [Deltaproteobacteria bacterium]|nr:MAG: hypothetical protein IPJ69_12020 [Deltaproteobacteria bacterium]